MEQLAKNILERRKNANFRPDNSEPSVPSAVSQHEAEAIKVMARRGIKAEAKAIADAPADDFGDDHYDHEHVPGSDVVDTDELDDFDDAEVPGEVIPAPMQWHEMDKKELREECDKLGIEYKKKDTNEKLIAKLTAGPDVQ